MAVVCKATFGGLLVLYTNGYDLGSKSLVAGPIVSTSSTRTSKLVQAHNSIAIEVSPSSQRMHMLFARHMGRLLDRELVGESRKGFHSRWECRPTTCAVRR